MNVFLPSQVPTIISHFCGSKTAAYICEQLIEVSHMTNHYTSHHISLSGIQRIEEFFFIEWEVSYYASHWQNITRGWSLIKLFRHTQVIATWAVNWTLCVWVEVCVYLPQLQELRRFFLTSRVRPRAILFVLVCASLEESTIVWYVERHISDTSCAVNITLCSHWVHCEVIFDFIVSMCFLRWIANSRPWEYSQFLSKLVH